MNKICENLSYLGEGPDAPSIAAASEIQKKYLSKSIEEIFDDGLHEYLEVMLERLGTLGRQIEQDFRFYE